MLKRFVDVRDEEVAAVRWSFLYFFTLMCGYAILRPIRNEMGTAGSVKDLDWLFTATFLVMLAAVPAFSALVARWPRQRVIPFVYRFFLLNLLGFFVVLKLDVVELSAWQAIQLPRSFSDRDRRPDEHPARQLNEMFARIKAALHAWMEVTDHLR